MANSIVISQGKAVLIQLRVLCAIILLLKRWIVNKVRLWVRRYLREMILAISLALFIGLAIPIGSIITGIDIRTPIIWYPYWVVLLLCLVAVLLRQGATPGILLLRRWEYANVQPLQFLVEECSYVG